MIRNRHAHLAIEDDATPAADSGNFSTDLLVTDDTYIG